MYGSGAVSCSCSLLIRGPNLARCQAEAPLIALCRFSKPALSLMAAIALLCVSSTVLAHDIYSNLRDRDGHLCCGGEDCRPVEATVLPNGDYYLPATDEVIPADIAAPSPDDRFHHCIYYPLAKSVDPWSGPVWEDKPKTRCFFAPMNST